MANTRKSIGAICGLALCLVVVSGCEFARAVKSAGDFCDTASPMILSKKAQDAMTDPELAGVTAHNEFGEKACKWKAPNG